MGFRVSVGFLSLSVGTRNIIHLIFHFFSDQRNQLKSTIQRAHSPFSLAGPHWLADRQDD